MTSIPTISQLYNSTLTDLQTEYGVTVPLFGKNFLRALAAVHAARLKLYYLAIMGLQKNVFPDTADPETAGGTLERFGRVKIGRGPFPATQGQYDITVTVTDPGGAGLTAGVIFKSNDDASSPGKLYIVDSGGSMSYPSDTATIRALEAGTGSKLVVGDKLTATVPLVDIDSQVTVLSEGVAPVAAEDIEDYRQVVLASYRLYPQGGASADYRIWGLEAAGVQQIYPYAASAAANEINVYVEATIASSTDGMGTPSATIRNNVASHIETDPVTSKGRRPLGVFAVHTLPVVINQIVITITGGSISTANRALITAALGQMVDGIRPFIAGADVLANKSDTLSTNLIINAILNTVPGTQFTGVAMTVQVGAGTPTTETVKSFDTGNIPFLTTVNYV